jgi:hypothetical protein
VPNKTSARRGCFSNHATRTRSAFRVVFCERLMSLLVQNLFIILLVGACLAFVSRQAYLSLAGRKSRLGQCCSKGCSSPAPQQNQPQTKRVVFMPVEMLTRRRK